MVGVIISAAVTTALACAMLIPLSIGMAGRTPTGVLKRLPAPGAEHRVRLNWMTSISGTWNPAKKPGIGNPLCTLGRGVYRLDDDDHVELTWTTADNSTRTYRGPIPDSVRPHSSQRRRARHLLRAAGLLYALVTIIGFAAGYGLSDGATTDQLGFGLLGVFAGWVLIWLGVLVANVAFGTKKALARGEVSDPTGR